ncbi:MAG: carbon storage regulator, partial [Dysosmobacter sp.]|nr:carbon storage regulator [Dysosmobacter sp.]
MLCLNLTPGEYMTIGEEVVVQLDRISGDRCKLMVQAPREIPVLRGEVLERRGGERPSCVVDAPRWHRQEIPWNRSKAQTLAAMRKLLGQMDGGDGNVQT